MGGRLTFVNLTPKDHGKAIDISQINSHTAIQQHAKHRADLAKKRRHRSVHRNLHSVNDVRGENAAHLDDTVATRHSLSLLHTASSGIHHEDTSSLSSQDNSPSLSRRSSDSTDSVEPRTAEPIQMLNNSSTGYQVSLHQNGRGKVQRMPIWESDPADVPISSTLDPFIVLPVRVSRYEKSLLHYYLTEGRTFYSATSLRPAYCVALRSAKEMLENSPVYVYSRIATTHAMLSQLTGQKLSESVIFKRRVAHTYKAMNDMLDNEAVSIFTKMAALAQVAVMEAHLGRQELAIRHVAALESYLEERGGFAVCCSRAKADMRWMGEFSVYNNIWMLAPLGAPSPRTFHAAFPRFMQNLKLMQQRSEKFRCDRTSSLAIVRSTGSTSSLPELSQYSDWILRGCFQPGAKVYPPVLEMMYFFHSICMSQIMYCVDVKESVRFLESFTDCLVRSETPERGTKGWRGRVSPVASASMLCYIRCRDIPNPVHTEIAMCQANIDMFRVVPFLSTSARFDLAERWLRWTLSVLDPALQIPVDCFDAAYLDELSDEISRNWHIGNFFDGPYDSGVFKFSSA